MPILVAIIGLLAPRFTIALLWLLSDWFTGVFETRLWPILGFLFFPFTLLWYSVVENWFAGEWTMLAWVVLIIAIFLDLGAGKESSKRRKKD